MSKNKGPGAGAVGFEIWIETFVDLSAASSIDIAYRKPDGTTTGTFSATSENRSGPRSTTRYGAKYVTTLSSDLDQAGEWELQVVATGVSGFTGPGEIVTMQVTEAL